MTATATDTMTVAAESKADARDKARWQWEGFGYRVLRWIGDVEPSPHPGRWRVTAELEMVR